MNFSLKDYGVDTIIAIDDVFYAIQENDILGDLPAQIIEIIDVLLGEDFHFFKDYSILEYMEETGDTDFLDRLTEEINNNERYSWLKPDGIDFKPIGADIELVKTAINNINSEDKSRKHLVVLDRNLQADISGVENNTLFKKIF